MERTSFGVDGAVATVTLQRPEQLNLIDHQTLTELVTGVDRLPRPDERR